MLHNCLCPPFDQTRTSCTRKELTVLITDLDIKEDALQTVSRRADVGVVRGERERVCVGEGVKAERFVHWWEKGRLRSIRSGRRLEATREGTPRQRKESGALRVVPAQLQPW